ncbi:phytoene synthase [Aquicoccus porphyridii]|uniref:Phytoene synthase n=1 Tax=Aquicoccus porphyridii TaxID=1852029 RepID=A0A5A9ZTV2_9RHOB|nr:squalene/phytoene synthase family protein [Aquicoccus porphyridii]KAA0920788.1 phytoene synthase [Aquicoccus porphyridii]RAI56666.1 phytoene synthase [Rhodobacteraceae bacterium AsT-22]
MSEDIAACAEIVQKGDPHRFRATMAAPVQAREKLFPLYAFNVEVARAPWVTSEPGIAEIRLQWWIEALEEIAAGGVVRRHEVVLPLAHTLAPDQARALIPLIEARQWDIYSDPFASDSALTDYLSDTSGRLMQVAVGLLGQGGEAVAQDAGVALGVANWLAAVPVLMAAGRHPLPDDSDAGIRALAEAGLDHLNRARRTPVPPSLRPAFLPMAGTARMLRAARARPEHVRKGGLDTPFRARLSLMKTALTGRW